MKCSAVVLSFNRVPNLGRIVENLRRHDWIDDIVIWHQGERLPPDFEVCCEPIWYGVREIHAHNRLRMGRFDAMDHCAHDAVLVQDDDTLPRNLDAAWQAWREEQSRIVALLDRGHLMTDRWRHWGDCHEVLLGWGAILDRRWRNVFRLWEHSYGVDELLERKADRIFSILQRRHHTVLLADYEKLPGADSNDAAWKQPDHDATTREARERCLNGICGMGLQRHEYRIR